MRDTHQTPKIQPSTQRIARKPQQKGCDSQNANRGSHPQEPGDDRFGTHRPAPSLWRRERERSIRYWSSAAAEKAAPSPPACPIYIRHSYAGKREQRDARTVWVMLDGNTTRSQKGVGWGDLAVQPEGAMAHQGRVKELSPAVTRANLSFVRSSMLAEIFVMTHHMLISPWKLLFNRRPPLAHPDVS
jgi:hypothetical protein